MTDLPARLRPLTPAQLALALGLPLPEPKTTPKPNVPMGLLNIGLKPWDRRD